MLTEFLLAAAGTSEQPIRIHPSFSHLYKHLGHDQLATVLSRSIASHLQTQHRELCVTAQNNTHYKAINSYLITKNGPSKRLRHQSFLREGSAPFIPDGVDHAERQEKGTHAANSVCLTAFGNSAVD